MDSDPITRGFRLEIATNDAEIARLRAILAPIIKHADAHDYAPPIRFSVMECREIMEVVNGTK